MGSVRGRESCMPEGMPAPDKCIANAAKGNEPVCEECCTGSITYDDQGNKDPDDDQWQCSESDGMCLHAGQRTSCTDENELCPQCCSGKIYDAGEGTFVCFPSSA